MAPKLAAMDTWRPHATVRIGLAVPGRAICPWSRRTGAPQASATGRDRTNPGPYSPTGLQRITTDNTASASTWPSDCQGPLACPLPCRRQNYCNVHV
jgi:hypothetical protein